MEQGIIIISDNDDNNEVVLARSLQYLDLFKSKQDHCGHVINPITLIIFKRIKYVMD